MTPPPRPDATGTPAVRRLGFALAGAIVLWAILAIVRSAGQDRIGGMSLAPVDTAAVDTVTLTRPGDTTVLARGGNGRWMVNGFAADTSRVAELLRGLRDSAMWSEQVSVSALSHERLQVDTAGLRVRVKTGAKTPVDLVVGKRTADYLGVYVRRPTEDAVYALHGADLAAAFTQPTVNWRDKRVATVRADSVGSVVLRRGTRSSTLRRAGTAWTLDGAPADSAAVASLLNAYRMLDAAGFATPAQADSARLDRPPFAVSLRSMSGAPLLGLSMDSTAAGVWARTESGHVVYRFDAWRLAQLLPTAGSLRRKGKA